MKYLLVLVFILGCSKPNDPKQLLAEFVSYRFSEGQSKDKLLEMTTGDLNQSIAQMSEEEFETFAKMPIKKKKFKILNSKCQELACSITYFVRYETYENNEKAFATEVKKVAKLEKLEGNWKIADVTNIKGFHDSLKPINIINN